MEQFGQECDGWDGGVPDLAMPSIANPRSELHPSFSVGQSLFENVNDEQPELCRSTCQTLTNMTKVFASHSSFLLGRSPWLSIQYKEAYISGVT